MGKKIDANEAIKIAQGCRRSKGLYSTNILRLVTLYQGPSVRLGGVSFGHADGEILEHSTEKFEVGKLDRIDAYIIAKFNDYEMLLLRCIARTEHVSIAF